jgi:hypothetical protein
MKIMVGKKILWPQGCTGSSPVPGTASEKPLIARSRVVEGFLVLVVAMAKKL